MTIVPTPSHQGVDRHSPQPAHSPHAANRRVSVPSFQRTVDALAKSRNEAATPALVAALTAGSGPIFDAAVSALCQRRCKAGHLAVLKHWDLLSAAQKQLVEKCRHRLGGALREALLDGDDQLFAAAYEFVEASGDYDLAPTLVTVAEQSVGERSQAAIKLTLALVDQLGRWVASNREPVLGRDPETIRLCVLESLERSVERFRQHRHPELLEAFVVLAGPQSGSLQAILNAPHHPCFQSVVHTLSTSASPNVLHLLTTMLVSREAPQSVRNVISKRVDHPFTDALLAISVDSKNVPLRRNLARIKSIACCEATTMVCNELSTEQQVAAMRLLAAANVTDDQKLTLAEGLLRYGAAAARVAACEGIRPIVTQRANKLIIATLEDADGSVQAAAVRQLRERRIPGALSKLMELVESHNEAVSEAARDALWEFSFDNFNSRFDLLDEEARQMMGVRVARVDRTAADRLTQDLSSPVRRQRLRAMSMATAMGLLPQVADGLIERLQDEDHLVRVAAAEALRHCPSENVHAALLAAADDRSSAVQIAARTSLQALETGTGAPADQPQPTLVGEGT